MDSLSKPRSRLSATEFAKTHYKVPALVEHGIRCGDQHCKCRGDYRHGPYAYLYWRDERGRSCRRYVAIGEVEAVRTIIERRRAKERDARRALAEAAADLRMLRQLLKEWRW
jgi:hypothetical protein